VTCKVAAIPPAQQGIEQQQSGLLDMRRGVHMAEKEANCSAIDRRKPLNIRWSGGLARHIK
jgi:hypothetical protein